MLLEFHLIDFAFMSAEHDVSAKPLSRKVPTKRHTVAYKLSRWDASDSHLISLPLLHVQSSKPSCQGMTLTAAIPFRGQADRFKPGDRIVYDELIASADEVIILSEYYYTRCFLDRDEFMVENASLLIAFYDGREKGGTYYTFKKANCLGIPVVNIY